MRKRNENRLIKSLPLRLWNMHTVRERLITKLCFAILSDLQATTASRVFVHRYTIKNTIN